jgi:hypothetical protein
VGFDHALRRDLYVGGLQIAMNDPFFVRGFEGLRDLARVEESRLHRKRSLGRFALHQLHDERSIFHS